MGRYHLRVAQNVNVMPLLQSVMRQPELWDENKFRTEYENTPHIDVSDIWLRFSDSSKCDTTSNVIGDDYPVWYPAAQKLPEARNLILALMNAMGGYELGRVLITKLPPGGRILPHADVDGSYVNDPTRVRYHMVLQGLPGSLYTTGDETVNMRTGEVWWFDHTAVHHIENNSKDDRIHMLIDMRIYP